MTDLQGHVAVVTGASRGVGKGIALALGAAGARVYLTGRSLNPPEDPRGSLQGTAEQIQASGGTAVALRCDHADDAQVKAVFQQVDRDQGRLDILVNNVMSTPQRSELPPGAHSQWDLHPFWEMPLKFWDSFHQVGLRSHFVASVYAVPLMIRTGGGLIVNISSSGASRYAENVAYGVAKAGVDKLAADMAEELRPYAIASVSLWPGFTRTEDVLGQADVYPDLARTVSPWFNGFAVVALAMDPQVMEKTGQHLKVSDLSQEYGFQDVDDGPTTR